MKALRNRRAAATTEYILLLAMALAIALALFWNSLLTALGESLMALGIDPPKIVKTQLEKKKAEEEKPAETASPEPAERGGPFSGWSSGSYPSGIPSSKPVPSSSTVR